MVWKRKQEKDGRLWFFFFCLSTERVRGGSRPQRRKDLAVALFILSIHFLLPLLSLWRTHALLQLHIICLSLSLSLSRGVNSHRQTSLDTLEVVSNVNEGRNGFPPPTFLPPHPISRWEKYTVVQVGGCGRGWGWMMAAGEWERYSWTKNKLTDKVKFALAGDAYAL